MGSVLERRFGSRCPFRKRTSIPACFPLSRLRCIEKNADVNVDFLRRVSLSLARALLVSTKPRVRESERESMTRREREDDAEESLCSCRGVGVRIRPIIPQANSKTQSVPLHKAAQVLFKTHTHVSQRALSLSLSLSLSFSLSLSLAARARKGRNPALGGLERVRAQAHRVRRRVSVHRQYRVAFVVVDTSISVSFPMCPIWTIESGLKSHETAREYV